MSAPDRHLGDAPGHWASRLLGAGSGTPSSLLSAPEPSIGCVPLKSAVHRSAILNDAAHLQLVGEHARSFQIRQSSADECAGVRVGVIVEAADARACVGRP
jgi:hypothetical protein